MEKRTVRTGLRDLQTSKQKGPRSNAAVKAPSCGLRLETCATRKIVARRCCIQLTGTKVTAINNTELKKKKPERNRGSKKRHLSITY